MSNFDKDDENVIYEFDNLQKDKDISSIIANAFASFVCSEMNKI